MADYTRILLRQGPELERNSVVLKSGEPAWVTDYQRVVVGDGIAMGGVSIGSKFLGFVTFDDISTQVNDVTPGYPGDFLFETSTNLLYVLSGSEIILGKKAYEIKTNYVAINKTPNPDEITVTAAGGILSVAQEGLDARYLAAYTFGRGIERDPGNSAIIRMKDTAPELSFKNNLLQITDSGVKFSKLESMFANEILASLDTGGSPRPYPLNIIAAALRPYLTGEIDGVTLGVPVGTIIDFAGPDETVPANYLPCDGRELDIEPFIELHSVLKGTWGFSETTFNLPNLNKRTTIGAGDDTIGSTLSSIGNDVGSYGGAESVRLSQKNLPAHIHGISFNIPAHNHGITVNLPKFAGSYETGDIMVNGFNNYITIIGGNGPLAAPATTPRGPVDAASNTRSEAAQVILDNKPYIQGRVVDYVYTNFPGALTATYTDSQGNSGTPLSAICYRDTGFIVNSLVADLQNNANHRSVETGILYFSGYVTSQFKDSLNRKGPSSVFALPQDQVMPTVLAISAIASFITGIGLPSYQPNYASTSILSASKYYTPLQQVVMDGLNNFTSVIALSTATPVTSPRGQVPDITFNLAAQDILSNKMQIQSRVVDYIIYNFPYALSGSENMPGPALSAKCFRDTGYIIDSIAADLANNANHRSVETGVFYFSGAVLNRASNGDTAVPTLPQDQVFATIQAISAIEGLTTGIRLPLERNYTTYGMLSSDQYYNASQLIMLSGLNNFTRVIAVSADVPVTTPMGFISAGNLDYFNAGNAINIYRQELQQQVVEYVKFNFPMALSAVSESESDALSAKCYRDTGYIVDAIVADIKNNANHRSIEAGQFYFKGAVLARLNNLGSAVPTLPANQVDATIAAISAIGKYIVNPVGALPYPPPLTPDIGILPDANLASLSGNVNDLISAMIYPLQNDGASLSYMPAGSATNTDQYYGYMLIDNKPAIQAAVSAYVLNKDYLTFNPLLSAEFTAKCNRDVGYMVDAIANDLITGVNARSVQYAVAYWDGDVSRIPDSNIPNQQQNTLDSIRRLRSAMLDVAVRVSNNVSNTAFKKINELIKTMIHPLQNNGSTLPYKPAGVPMPGAQQSSNILRNNREQLQNSISNYVSRRNYLPFGSDMLAKCKRDAGFMVDAIINDLETGVNAKSIQYALAYWDGSTSRLPENFIPNQQINTIDTINFLRSEMLMLLPQEPGIASQILNLVSTMYYPLLNRGKKLPYSPAGAVMTQERAFAANILERSRKFIQDKVAPFVTSLNIINDNSVLKDKCYRDTGYMIDSVVNDLRTGTDAQSIQFALAYWTGNANRLGGQSSGLNNNVNQIAATMSTIRFLRDTCIDLVIENGGGTTQTVPVTSTTSLNNVYEHFGYTDDGDFLNAPINNLQPSAVVNKIIKVK